MTCQLEKVSVAIVDEQRWLNTDEDRAWRGFRRLLTLLPPAIERDLRLADGLSAADYEVLSNISEQRSGTYRLKDLADRLLWSRSRLSHHVSRMEERGLVVRSETSDDGRGAVVELTKQGMTTITRAAPSHVASVRSHFIDELTKEELAVLAGFADRVVSRLEENSTNG